MREPHEGSAGRDRKPDGHTFTIHPRASFDGLQSAVTGVCLLYTDTTISSNIISPVSNAKTSNLNHQNFFLSRAPRFREPRKKSIPRIKIKKLDIKYTIPVLFPILPAQNARNAFPVA
ncbi:hypothetical protein FJTKL_01135 [Diaporthe vaccinii]|uniref:Uncharacterized protein n=1 Tax=Diaporthe vaccinii TaxID=105482 RepID=A0ABR4F552_9PEZI